MFKEYYNEHFSDSGRSYAEKILVQNTLGRPLFGTDKVTELTAMDFESTFNKDFIPSMIYTFQYETTSKEQVGNNSFIDYVPIILCCTNRDGFITGINLNFLPNDVRAEMLDIIYNAYKSFYENKLADAVKDGSATFNNELANFLINEITRNEFIKIMSYKLKFSVEQTYRRYNKLLIKNPRLIEFDQWKYIPCLTFKNAVRGVSLAEIQQDIIKNK